VVMSCHGVSPLYILTHAGCRGHLCILQSSPLGSDPYYVGFGTTCRRTIPNLSCLYINCSRIRSYPRSWTIVGCGKFFNGALRISSHYRTAAYRFNPHGSIPRYQSDPTQQIGNECAFPTQMLCETMQKLDFGMI
jgi:hypothetical protein